MNKIEKFMSLIGIVCWFILIFGLSVYSYVNQGMTTQEVIFYTLGGEQLKSGTLFILLFTSPYFLIIYFIHQYFVNQVNTAAIYILIRKKNIYHWTIRLLVKLFIQIFSILSLIAVGLVISIAMIQGLSNMSTIILFCLKYIMFGSVCLYIMSMLVNILSIKLGSSISFILILFIYIFTLVSVQGFFEAPSTGIYLFSIIPCQFIALQHQYIEMSIIILSVVFITCNGLILLFLNKLDISNQIKR